MNRHRPALFDVSLKVLLVNRKGEFLILKGSEKSIIFGHGHYDLPGGRINTDEMNKNFHGLIDREIKEEVGPTVKYVLRKDPVSLAKGFFPPTTNAARDGKAFVLFEAKYKGGKIVLSDEHVAYEWRHLNTITTKRLFHPIMAQLITNYLQWKK